MWSGYIWLDLATKSQLERLRAKPKSEIIPRSHPKV